MKIINELYCGERVNDFWYSKIAIEVIIYEKLSKNIMNFYQEKIS